MKLYDFRDGECVSGACSDGPCPELVLCAIDRAAKALGSETVRIRARDYEILTEQSDDTRTPDADRL